MDCRLLLLLIYIKKGLIKGDRLLSTDILNGLFRWKADFQVEIMAGSDPNLSFGIDISTIRLNSTVKIYLI